MCRFVSKSKRFISFETQPKSFGDFACINFRYFRCIRWNYVQRRLSTSQTFLIVDRKGHVNYLNQFGFKFKRIQHWIRITNHFLGNETRIVFCIGNIWMKLRLKINWNREILMTIYSCHSEEKHFYIIYWTFFFPYHFRL